MQSWSDLMNYIRSFEPIAALLSNKLITCQLKIIQLVKFYADNSSYRVQILSVHCTI